MNPAQIEATIQKMPEAEELGLGLDLASLAALDMVQTQLCLEEYTLRIVWHLIRDLGLEEDFRAGCTPESLIQSHGLAEQSLIPLAWMCRFLTHHHKLREVGDRFSLLDAPSLDLQEIRDFCQHQVQDQEASFQLLDALRQQILPFFTQGKNGEALLFDLGMMSHWFAFFRNENLVYLPNNLATWASFYPCLRPDCRVLELGGGAGSFAELLAQKGDGGGNLAMIREYRFTDVVPTFIRKAQRELKSRAPGIPFSFGSLDIQRPFALQGIEAASLDLIVGVNVVHVAKSLDFTLGEIRQALKPGGHFVLGECMRPSLETPLYVELFFTFLDSYTRVQLEPDTRPIFGFLTPDLWRKNLEKAGFIHIRESHPIRSVLEKIPFSIVGGLSAQA